MNKESLIHLFNEGIIHNRISEEDQSRALALYSSIYETHTASESGVEHKTLATLINQASGVKVPSLSDEEKTAVIEAEIASTEEFLSLHPILSTSPLDLERSNTSVEEYLSGSDGIPRWTSEDVELWKLYYDI